MRTDTRELGSRRFLFVSHRTPVDGSFNLNDLPGSGGRVDVLARCVSSSLLISNAIRRDASVSIHFGGDSGKTVVVSGMSVRYLNPDERSTAALIRNALVKARETVEGEASPGIHFFTGSLADAVRRLAGGCRVYYLREDGTRCDIALPALFILGDSMDLTKEEEKAVGSEAERASISRVSQQSDQCALIVNWLLDNGEMARELP